MKGKFPSYKGNWYLFQTDIDKYYEENKEQIRKIAYVCIVFLFMSLSFLTGYMLKDYECYKTAEIKCNQECNDFICIEFGRCSDEFAMMESDSLNVSYPET